MGEGCWSAHVFGAAVIALPYDSSLIVWFVLGMASTAYVAYDQFAGNPNGASSGSRSAWDRSGSCSTSSPTRSRDPESTKSSRLPMEDLMVRSRPT